MKKGIDCRWISLKVPATELRLSTTLSAGQSFTWVSTGHKEWAGVLEGHLLALRQSSLGDVEFCAPLETLSEASARDLLVSYFQLHIPLGPLYASWAASDPKNFAKKALSFPGLRILRQDPVETTFAFICSSNNNIKRITGMVQALSRNFGSHIGTWRDTDFYSFPSVQALSGDGIEAQLRELGFGYRAKYISQSAQFLCSERPDNPDAWLTDLRGQSYPLVKESLLKLMGVGPKVADCIALMAMDVTECVPVDTHVWQIALRDYSFPGMNGRHKSLTEKTYTAIGDGFRNVFGAYAGWAHSVLFAADLRHLQLLVQEEDALQSKTEEKLEIPIKEEAHISIKKEESTTLEEDSFVCDEDTLVEADIKPDLKRLKAE